MCWEKMHTPPFIFLTFSKKKERQEIFKVLRVTVDGNLPGKERQGSKSFLCVCKGNVSGKAFM